MKNINLTVIEIGNEGLPLIPVPMGERSPQIKWKNLRNQEPMSYRVDFTDSNIALLTGNTLHHNFVCFDFDTYSGHDSLEAAKALIDSLFGDIPWSEAYIQTTPSGGVHYVFRAAKGVMVKSGTDFLKDKEHCVDIRADGGLLILAPSQAISKQNDTLQPYVHTNNIALEHSAMLDSSVCQKLMAKSEIVSNKLSPTVKPLEQTVQMNNYTASFFNEVISRCVSNLVMTSQGSRNNELNRQAFKIGQFVGGGIISYQEAHAMLSNAATQIGLPITEINATLSSGLQAGLQKPIKQTNDNFLGSSWIAEHQICSIWEAPQQLEEPLAPVMSLTSEMLPQDLYDYAVMKAHALDNASAEFIAIPALISYAAALGTSHVIKPKAADPDWKETPVLWGGLIAPPSAKKSPCLSVGTKPVKKVQAHLTKEFLDAVKKAKVKAKLIEKKAKALEEEANDAFEIGDEELANQKLTESEELRSKIVKPVERKVMINDATIEAIGVRLSGTKDGVMILRDELSGLLVDFKDERSPVRSFYLEAYNGNNEFITERISREQTHIPRLAIWMCGGIQPDKLMPFLHARKYNADNDGLLERMQLLVMPDIPEGKYIDQPMFSAEKQLVERVNDAFVRAGTIGFNEKGKSHVVSFHPIAQQAWANWVQEQHNKINSVDKDMQPVLGKHIGLCARLALVFHIFEGNSSSDPILESTLNMAIHFVAFLETHQYRIFSSCEKTVLHDLSKLFLKKLDGLPNPFTLSDVSDKKWSAFGKDNRDIVLENLCEKGYLLRIQNKSKQGRPTILYYKHPDYCGA
ncbi:TPA: DUF3987 domain-containing protein [Vibrio parahaemolyticus]